MAKTKLQELAEVAGESKELNSSVELDVDGKTIKVLIFARYSGYSASRHFNACSEPPWTQHNVPTFEDAMRYLAAHWSRGTLKPETITFKTKQCPLSRSALKELITAAWYEVFGLSVPPPAAMRQRKQTVKTSEDEVRDEMLSELRGGSAGLKKWNARGEKERYRLGKFRGAEMANTKLSGAKLQLLDFRKANFEGASLTKSDLQLAQLEGANFKNADLTETHLTECKLAEASFENANLTRCSFYRTNCRGTRFHHANLEEAFLNFAYLCAADLSTANLRNATWLKAVFDEQTQWPPGFVLPAEMKWRGKGPDPRTRPALAAQAVVKVVDFTGLLKFLGETTDARLAKALQMLKADRFRLFADLKTDSVVGVVKSQTDKKLVYSCALAADGSFACCTQNLKLCGGMTGNLCKHLLVLLIGLAKSGELNPAMAHRWVAASQRKKPQLDKDVMTETFLRYKNAEAGEVDWRPTETIPEDYYAL